jgi:ATP-dependent 26S proteasome regulatory subunit
MTAKKEEQVTKETKQRTKPAVPLARPLPQKRKEDAPVAPDNVLAQQVEGLQENLQEATDVIMMQEGELARHRAKPLVFGTVVSTSHDIKPERFENQDKFLVVDERCGPYHGRIGTIVSDGVDAESGTIRAEFFGVRTKPHFTVGIGTDPETDEPRKKQIQLLNKNDGSNIVVSLDGKIAEVWNWYQFDPEPGDTAKCDLDNKAVMEISPPSGVGDLCTVLEIENQVGDNRLEVETGGMKRIVYNYFAEVEVGDKVVLDPQGVITVRHTSNANTKRFKLTSEQTVTWKDIGALNSVKQEIDEAIVFPHTHKDIYEFYSMETSAGFLLYGPPGCGKTLVGKAAAASLAEIHGKEAVQSGFNLVKGPEILSKWVGESEAESRAIFARMRKHYDIYGYPCVTFVDEADALFTERGADQAQKWHDTLVAMWLAEMDGFDRRGGMLILASNRPKSIDGAVVREGRIDKAIKVCRPDRDNAPEIFHIHLRTQKVPLNGTEPEEVIGVCLEELLDNTKPICQIHEQPTKRTEIFTLAHCISGSMIAAIVRNAKQLAVRRDLQNGKNPQGVLITDFREAVQNTYVRHRDINHKYDILDFCEVMGMNFDHVKQEPINALG